MVLATAFMHKLLQYINVDNDKSYVYLKYKSS